MVEFTGLPPGEYSLAVTGRDAAGKVVARPAMFPAEAVSGDRRNYPQFAPTAAHHGPDIHCFTSWMPRLNDLRGGNGADGAALGRSASRRAAGSTGETALTDITYPPATHRAENGVNRYAHDVIERRPRIFVMEYGTRRPTRSFRTSPSTKAWSWPR